MEAVNKSIPLIGMGTFQIKDYASIYATLDCGFFNGYRLVDTASVYKNEAHIGQCFPHLLAKHKLQRKDIFVTTKLGPKELLSKTVDEAVTTSLDKLQLDYVDLYLVHWPGKQGIKSNDVANQVYRKETWLGLEEVYQMSTKIKHLGVSNYTLSHLTEMLDYANFMPHVLQSEFHIDYQNDSVMSFCHKHNIHYQAYSSLGTSKLINDHRLTEFSKKYEKSTPQVLLRWALQKGCSVLPKSQNPSHIEENMNIFDFEISDADMDLIGKSGKNIKYCWNPSHVL